jgi:hypothetical protein
MANPPWYNVSERRDFTTTMLSATSLLRIPVTGVVTTVGIIGTTTERVVSV